MDILYNSAAFWKASYNQDKNIYLWCYKEGNKSHPAMHYRNEYNSKKAHIDTRRTSKEAFLEGNPKLPTFEAIMYDNNPLHYISIVSE